ncbi:Crp/Fnr family transcriptional regulator [Streptomyces profundus]|uniref:Crp/Fnr family transcriptional regulator n=1 Tax=Streptomyces profundus TaxID=2867410 RepID=UPI001D1624AF|nr:Crp/Fnr family transcriptional regulator [Streptomyces sp. MA3_2.13]UED85543.1 Crp/Fnr family transcriptional regulator [Streptomyces sp. MA3_2.13]
MSLFGQGRAFLDALPPQDRRDLIGLGALRSYAPGEVMIQEGDRTTFVLVILSGWSVAQVSTDRGSRLILALRGAGDLVGELAAVDDRPRSATVKALGELRATVLPGGRFRGFLASRPVATTLVMRQLSSRLRSSDQERRELASGTVLRRLAIRLLELTERTGREVEGGTVVDLPLPQHDLAAAIGTSREAVAKSLRLLREQDVIRTRPRRLVISDLPLLRLLAEGGEL